MTDICPLTLKAIKKYGIISSGNYYEYEAIEKWLSQYNTDPTSGIKLRTKIINTTGITKFNVRIRCKQIKADNEESLRRIFVNMSSVEQMFQYHNQYLK